MSSLHVICQRTSHPGNIGAVARSMKTCGLSQLHLVQPKIAPNEMSYDRATVHAHDILDNCHIHDQLSSCSADFDLIYAFTNRPRDLHLPFISVEHAAYEIQQYSDSKIGLLFGSERSGLTNEELLQAHCCVTIPTANSRYAMNLSHAIQTALYVITRANQEPPSIQKWPSIKHKTAFLHDIDQRLHHAGFYKKEKQASTQMKLKCIFQRARLSHEELQLLHGIIAHINRDNKADE